MLKRFLTKKSVAFALTSIILVGFFSFNFTYAANTDCYDTSGNVVGTQTSLGLCNVGSPTPPGGTTAITSANLTSSSNPTPTTPSIGEAALSPIIAAKGMLDGIMDQIAKIGTAASGLGGYVATVTVLGTLRLILSTFIWITGLLFDYSIKFSIIDISNLFSNLSNPGVVTALWTVIRDLLNISFIFILLYIAITMILGNLGAKSKATIVSVIISAILINFSLFITKILIDAGNMVAVQLYNQIVVGGTGGAISSISGQIFTGVGFTELVKSGLSLTSQLNVEISLLVQVIGMAILMWTFLYYAMVIVGRTVMLMFLAIISPVGFVGETIPGLGELSGWWWKTLTDQILVAPILMFFLLFIIKLTQVSGVITKGVTAGATISADVSGIFVYILVIVMLLQGLKITKKFSGEVGAMAVKVFQGATVAAGVVATAGAGAVALGAGALSSAGAEAAVAAGSKVGKTAFRSRLEFAGKQLWTPSKDFVTGKLNEKPGIVGMASRFVRGNIVGGIKNATGGAVDIEKMQKNLEKSKAEEEKRIMALADKLGGKKEGIELKNVTDTEKNIEKQAEQRLKDKNITAPENGDKTKKELETKLETSKAKKEETEKTLKESEANLEKKKGTIGEGAAATEYKAAEDAHESAKTDFSAATTKIENFKKEMDKYNILLNAAKDAVADEMGTSTAEIKTRKSALSEALNKAKAKRNEMAKEIAEGGFVGNALNYGLWGKEASQEISDKIRANFDLKKKKMKDILLAVGEEKKDDEKEGEEAPKKEETPEAA